MKKILFVDDESMVLQGIERTLRGMRGEWDMTFALGGEQGKAALLAAAFDLVITDMMMPGIDGVVVLAFAREHSPKTIRMVLSGHAEQNLTMKCVGLAHQYLAKPCEAQSLRQAIARVTSGSFMIRSQRSMALVATLDHLPSLPANYSEIVRLLNDPNSSVEAVGALIATDMAMTAKILQLVNSSFFGLARRVAQPIEAAAYLGMNTLKALALATNVFAQFEVRMPRGFSSVAASEHSHRVGSAARAIAQSEKCTVVVQDEALVAGLLHDVGKLVLASSLPEEFQRVLDHDELPPLEAEREVFGVTHAEVGGYLLGLWGLPTAVVEAISLHHEPEESVGTEFCALTAVHVADCLIGEQTPMRNGVQSHQIDVAYLTRLGLADRLPAWRETVAALASLSDHS